MKKLLNKPLKSFSVYALLILLSSIPVYHFLLNAVWVGELDERNELTKIRVQHMLSSSPLDDSELSRVVHFWNVVQPGIELNRVEEPIAVRDSLYSIKKRESTHSDEQERYRALTSYFEVDGNYYRLKVETNVDEADETLFIIGAVTVLFFILLLVGFVLLNRRISKGVWQPFYDTIEKLKTFNLASEENIAFTESDIAEFEELNSKLHALIEKNIAVYRKQRQFVENASHELQTPVALLRSKLDLVLQSESLTEEQVSLVAKLMPPLSRLTRLNKNLLLLAKLENRQFPEHGHIRLDALIEENIELFEDYFTEKGIHIQTNLLPFEIDTNRLLLEALLGNLISNAVNYSDAGSIINISLRDGILTFSNPGTAPLNQDTVFDRFGRSSQETGNVGLGLAIVKEIGDQNHWSVRYAYEHDRHVFSIAFR